jgi:hypothetical protein
MKFNPKFPTFRRIIATLALMFAVVGSAELLAGDRLHHGRWAVLIGVLLALLSYFMPKSSAEKKKPEPEKYHLTGSQP